MKANRMFFFAAMAVFLFSGSSGVLANNVVTSTASKVNHHSLWLGVTTVNDAVGRNEKFSDILRKHHVDELAVKSVMSSDKSSFNPARLKQGTSYKMMCREVGDSTLPPDLMVFHQDELHDVVFHFKGEETEVETQEKKVENVDRLVSGTIEGSLWESLERVNANPELASHMAEIYAYTLNFFKIMRGDKFKILYTEKVVDGESLEIVGIKACLLNYHGKDYYAFNYLDKDGKSKGFFDEEGRSLKMRFLAAPVKYSRISSRYTTHRLHPVTGVVKGHFGTDFAAQTGTPIMSTSDGVVLEACFKVYNGNYVKIKHDKTYTTQYLHMCRIAKGMRPGAHVAQGQVIGYVGSTGLATGPHVCYRFWKNGKQVDPFKEVDAKCMPLAESEKSEFLATVGAFKGKMDGVDFNHSLIVLDTLTVQAPFIGELSAIVPRKTSAE